LDKKKIDYALEFVLKRYEMKLFKDDEYSELMIYIVLDKANLLSRQSYEDAVSLIEQSIDTYGDDERLIKIKKALINNWIATYLDKKEWDKAEELVHTMLKKGGITEEQWKKSMSYVFDGRAADIAKEEGNLEAAFYLKKALEILGEDRVLQNNYEYYLYNYTAEIHNKVIALVKEKKYTEAIALINEGLQNVPGSSLLKKDMEKVREMME
jgi:tetratricopeptide (TPR) repeat protein